VTRPALLVRADASPAIGMGHVMRCLSLVSAFIEGTDGTAVFLTAEPLPAFTRRAVAAGAEVRGLVALPGSSEDAEETLAVAAEGAAAWVVLDGYQFDGAFQAALVDGGRRLLALDDHGHAGRYHANIVLNQNAGADAELYRDRRPTTRLLLGPRFAMLREEFRKWAEPRSPVPTRARRVVVALGGSDPDDVSALALDGLARVSGPLEVLVLVGAANQHLAELERAAAACPHTVEVAVDVLDVPRALAWGDLAIAAAGGTSWELARVGTPQVAIVLADNQRPAAAALARERRAVTLGWHSDLDAGAIGAAVAALVDDRELRCELSRRGRELVDGRGALRVLAEMELLSSRGLAA
jgi:UDP-2,4-diacetamido-2,4,6-trideoxy-beta-L-altropyranose hydrolase